jgi:hypothetical protein
MWQCYDAKFLKVYSSMPPSPLQLEEDLEQLKVLEYGYKLKVITTIRFYFYFFLSRSMDSAKVGFFFSFNIC